MAIVYSLIARDKFVLAEYTGNSGNFPTITRMLLTKVDLSKPRMSYVYDNYIFHYIIEEGLVYLCLAEECSKRRIPFAFLDAIKDAFTSMYGDRVHTAIAFAMNDEFQHILREKMDFYNTDASENNVQKVQMQLDSIKDVMVTNIEKVLERGEKIELLVDRTDRLHQKAFTFEKKARTLKRNVQWQNRKRKCLGILFLLVLLYFMLTLVCGLDLHFCRK